jgi:hypothetical protein
MFFVSYILLNFNDLLLLFCWLVGLVVWSVRRNSAVEAMLTIVKIKVKQESSVLCRKCAPAALRTPTADFGSTSTESVEKIYPFCSQLAVSPCSI